MPKWRWILSQLNEKIWFRTTLFCAIGIFTALFAPLVKDYIPENYAHNIGAQAVDSILQIIATSMLTVTVFSLNTMVTTYATISASATPRATELLLKDSTAQNALSTFIGAFLYSLVGIVALRIDVYGQSGRLVLFVVTLGVIFVIIAVLIRWVNRLARLGRVGETINMVEQAAKKAIKQRIDQPCLGGTLLENDIAFDKHYAITHPTIGFIQHIDMAQLSQLADKHNLELFIKTPPGCFNDSHAPILYSTMALSSDEEQLIRKAFSINDCRSFDQDPRYGLIVLSEIASRALSPAMNDPGTAIDVIDTALRLLVPWIKPHHEEEEDVLFPRIHVPAVQTEDLFKDLFMPIARDGAHILEVGIRLQKAYASLASMGNNTCKNMAKVHSALSQKRALSALTLQEEKEIIKKYAL
ncbi:MAG: DUF2254 domain-containing protein [Methylocystaceae bacterium]|nr:DUF2254 domain-containing protein [Methylocystaceae bacterium]